MLRKRAFTLAELVVVLSVMFVLVFILAPVFQRARDLAQARQCISNLHLIGRAISQYDSDYDEHLIKTYYAFPPACNWSAPNGSIYYSWRHALAPYQPSVQVWACPTNPYAGQSNYFTNNTSLTGPGSDWLPYSYATDTNVIGFANGNCNDPVNTPEGDDLISQITHPSMTILVTDNRSGWMSVFPSNIGDTYGQIADSTPTDYQGGDIPTYPDSAGAFEDHATLVNFLMADDHVRPMALARSIVPYDYWQSGLVLSARQKELTTMPAEYIP